MVPGIQVVGGCILHNYGNLSAVYLTCTCSGGELLLINIRGLPSVRAEKHLIFRELKKKLFLGN